MQDFSSKRDALFASLDDASKEIRGTALDQSGTDRRALTILKRSASEAAETEEEMVEDMVYRRGKNFRLNIAHSPDHSLAHLRGKESIFKKPDLPIGRCLKPRKTPDYQINPHKWKKYSLSDVDISDQTNTSAALAFLREMDEQRDAEAALETTDGSSNAEKIEFKRSTKIRCNLRALEAQEVPDAEVDKPKLRGSKLVMPEYVVGQKRESHRRKPQKSECTRAVGQLNLAHLHVEEEDEDNEEG